MACLKNVNIALLGDNQDFNSKILLDILNIYSKTKYTLDEIVNLRNTRETTVPLIWNFKVKKMYNVNISIVPFNLDSSFSKAIVQSDISFFALKDSISELLKQQIIASNILGLKHTMIYHENIDYNTITKIFTNRNFKKCKMVNVAHLNREFFEKGLTMFSKYQKSQENKEEITILPITNVFNYGDKWLGVNGTILNGEIDKNGFLFSNTNKCISKIEEIQIKHLEVSTASKGDNVGIKIKKNTGISEGDLLTNNIIDKSHLAKLQVFILNGELDTKNIYTIDLFGQNKKIKILSIAKTINNLNKTILKHPEKIVKNDTAIVNVEFRDHVPLMLYSKNYKLGSFLIKNTEDSTTIGIGIVKTLR